MTNMKKISLVKVIMAVAFLATAFPAYPQGEWKWAHYWTGGGGNYNDIFNNVTNTAFDEEGNIYVYGTMGGNASLDGEILMFSNNSDVITTAEQSILLAKFDTLGTMLWYKVIKCNSDYLSVPKWMEVKNDRIFITGMTGMWGDYNYWLYYIDTLITKADVLNLPESERRPPYKHSRWTFFSQLDLDGNRIEDHFVEGYSRQYYPNGNDSIRSVGPIYSPERHTPTPMHVDDDGCIYLFARFDYKGEEEDPYTIVIDGDTSKTYDLYLPGSSCGNSYLHNAMFYKFTPNWELEFAKLMVQNTEGIATPWDLAGDSINPQYIIYPEWLSFDQEDNMYVSGYVNLSLSVSGASLHQYPIHIYFDSLHYASIIDMSGTRRLNFVIKYNSDGDILWCNQIYTKGHPTAFEQFSHGELYGNCYQNNSIYIVGRGCSALDENVGIFFDSTCSIRLYGPQDIDMTNVGFFVRYDASSGDYMNHGVVPVIEDNSSASPGPVPAVINNRVFALSLYKQFSWDPAIIQWNTDGNFISHIPFSTGQSELGAVKANQDGTLLVDMVAFSPVTFSNNVVADCNNPGGSHAIFALYHNSEFTESYVGIIDYGEKLSNLKIWPNPTIDFLNIESDNTLIDYITIIDLSGKTHIRKNVGSNNTSLNVSLLPAGTYLLETVCKGEVSVNKFVKHNK